MSELLPVRVVERAARQIVEAADWWALHRPAAPGAVEEELRSAFQLLAEYPRIGAQARNTRLKSVRRLALGRIRYDLYYRVAEKPPGIEVLAFWHANRGRGPVL